MVSIWASGFVLRLQESEPGAGLDGKAGLLAAGGMQSTTAQPDPSRQSSCPWGSLGDTGGQCPQAEVHSEFCCVCTGRHSSQSHSQVIRSLRKTVH